MATGTNNNESTNQSQLANLLNTATTDDDDDEYKPKTGKKNKNKGNTTAAAATATTAIDMEIQKLKQRRINVAGAPKMPLNGYVRFMNDRREELRREFPQRTALEHTKMIGEEWQHLAEDRKAPYLAAAAKDKALYYEEMRKFLEEHPEIVANELSKAKKNSRPNTVKEKPSNPAAIATDTPPAAPTAIVKKQTPKVTNNSIPDTKPDPDDLPLAQVKRTPTPPVPRSFAAGEIPIYTSDFLEHNRNVDLELRTLRKAKADLEQQHAVLGQHVENTKAGHTKVMSEVTELKEENARLEAYLMGLRRKLLTTLSGFSSPPIDAKELSLTNIDKYLEHLAMANSTPGNTTDTSILSQLTVLNQI